MATDVNELDGAVAADVAGETAEETTSEDEVCATRIDIEYQQQSYDEWGPLPPKGTHPFTARCRATLYFNGKYVETQNMYHGLEPRVIAALAETLKQITEARHLLGDKLGPDKADW